MVLYGEKHEKRCWILLLVLKRLKKIVTRTKLQKLVFLIQDESLIKDGYHFRKSFHGPHSSRLTTDVELLAQEHIVNKETKIGYHNRTYYVYEATDKVDEVFEDYVCPEIDKDLISRADTIIEKYRHCEYNELTEYIYKKYLPEQEKYKERRESLLDEITLIEKLWEEQYNPVSVVFIDVMSTIEYINLLFEKLADKESIDRVVKGVLLVASEDLTENLFEITGKYFEKIDYKESLSYLNELFDFINFYSNKNKVLPNMSNLDFSELMTEEEMERLQQTHPTENLVLKY